MNYILLETRILLWSEYRQHGSQCDFFLLDFKLYKMSVLWKHEPLTVTLCIIWIHFLYVSLDLVSGIFIYFVPLLVTCFCRQK